jgi:hypothetical protein
MNSDVRKGFLLGLGAVAAFYVFGIATGIIRRVI